MTIGILPYSMPVVATKHAGAGRRLGLVYRSGNHPEKAWSGIPAGLARGLRELGLESHFIDAEPPRAVTLAAKTWAAFVRGNRHGGMLAPEIRELRCLTAYLRARGAGALDAVIQMGSDFGVPFSGQLAMYEDMTVEQFLRVAQVEPLLGSTAARNWVAAQATCYDVAVACCVASRWAADSIVRDYGVDRSKVHVVGCGRNYEPRSVNRDWAYPRFFFMGYDWERKNGPMLLRAFAHLKEREPDARLDIAGGHPRVEMDGVVAHGPLDVSQPRDRARAHALFETATCFVMPSKFEPFGMVYVEAAVAGVPSIGTIVGGARDVIGEDGGLLVNPSSQEALVEAMALMCQPSRASVMGAAALRRSGLFTWRAVAERIIGVLQPLPRPSVDLADVL